MSLDGLERLSFLSFTEIGPYHTQTVFQLHGILHDYQNKAAN